ncbi:MAG: glycosyltransferase family 2 protein [Bryobacteraceae bacterium]
MQETKQSRGPLVSIVTPSYNMARFLGETIESVLSQDYPHIEYIVMDGGSTDGTVDLLRKYEGRLRYLSEPDKGQGDAVNRGFRLSEGQIFTFLNADDTYLPGAVSAAVRAFEAHPQAGVVYGDAYHVKEGGEIIGPYPTQAFDPERFRTQCYICQPASFLQRDVFERAGMLNPELHFALDYDLWIRISRLAPMRKIDEYLATSRMHENNKTLGQLPRVFEEVFGVLKKHYGYIPANWMYGYGSYRASGQSPALSVPRPTAAGLALTVLLGSYYNKRHLLRYWKDLYTTTAQTIQCKLPS